MLIVKCSLFVSALCFCTAAQINIQLPDVDRIVNDALSNAFQAIPSMDPSDPKSPLHGLDNLGEQINNQVQQGLQPVYALEIRNKIKNGFGGTTIAKYEPSGTIHVIKDGQIEECKGAINSGNGACDGQLTPLDYKVESNWCFAPSRVVTGNHVCLASNGPLTVNTVNDQIYCSAKLMTVKQYNDLCKLTKGIYTYYADPNNPSHVVFPITNKYVDCVEKGTGICELTEEIHPILSANYFVVNQNVY